MVFFAAQVSILCCYHLLRAGDTPDINCDNTACGKPFHRRCLVEWLNSGGRPAWENGGGEQGLSGVAACLLTACAQFLRLLSNTCPVAPACLPRCLCLGRHAMLLSLIHAVRCNVPLVAPAPPADASTRQSFNTLFGACPYCSAPITVKTG